MNPKISVIVPVYKAEKCLHRCVDSILAQTFTDFEVLLIDDGSPDRSGEICDEYAKKDSRVRVFHKENGGVSSARNYGIKQSYGEWLTFVDSDDYIENNFLDFTSIESADLLVQNYKVLFENRSKNIEFPKQIVQEQGMSHFINSNIVKQIFRVPWAKFFKRNIISKNKISFAEGIRYGEDTLFVQDYLFCANSVSFISKSNYIYIEDKNVASKYRLSAVEAVNTLTEFMKRYHSYNVDSIPLLIFVYDMYHHMIYPIDTKSMKYWNSNKEVRNVYEKIRPFINFKLKLKFTFFPIYKIYRFFSDKLI